MTTLSQEAKGETGQVRFWGAGGGQKETIKSDVLEGELIRLAGLKQGSDSKYLVFADNIGSL